MPIVPMKKLLEKAIQEKRGVGAFNVGNMEMVKGVIQAAEETNTSVILQIAEARLKYSPLNLMGPMMVQAAWNARVDVAVHLDHGRNYQTVEDALDMGFTSVMYDSSLYSFEENIERTCAVVDLAARYGATVEAELGMVGGSEDDGKDQEIRFTAPDQAALFCEKTGVDALAVAIGNAHGNYAVTPRLAFDVLEKIHQKTSTPLVLHGGSGISDADFRKAISLGIVKVNIATASFNRLTSHAERYLRSEEKHDYFGLSQAMVDGTYENVKHHINVFNCRVPLYSAS
jgi:fructose-bisphosphate aldolase class II